MGSCASQEGTRGYVARFTPRVAARQFRERAELWVSSLGLGTYLGAPDERTDELYTEAVIECVRGGINVIDTAINYRLERSERAIGKALAQLFREGYRRDEIVLATKGGYIPARDAALYFHDHIVSKGLARMSDLAASCHSMAPLYLRHELLRSLEHLGVEAVDIYYVHNPETQLEEVARESFLGRLRRAFEALERAVHDGLIRCYGTATWNGYRLPSEERGHLSLEDVVHAARAAGGVNHHFRVVQAPLNLAMPEAFTLQNQSVAGARCTLLEAADRLGVQVVASGSLLQGRVLRDLPQRVRTLMRQPTDAAAALQLVRSVPGLMTALVGMKSKEHVRANLELAKVDLADAASVRACLAGDRVERTSGS
ncbi:MAG: aldo/keto reductase [Planctomycetota bacterium]